MKTSESILKISAAIVSAQAEVKGAFKDGKNTFFKNAAGQATAYATLDSVIEAAREALSKNRLAIIQAPISLDGSLFVESRVQHESGEYYEVLTPLLFTKQDMQGFGSAITYAKRYALGSLLNISTDGDDDGNKAAESESKPKSEGYKPKSEPKPQFAKDPNVFEGGKFQGKNFSEVPTQDFLAELSKYEMVEQKTPKLTSLIERMTKFLSESEKTQMNDLDAKLGLQ